jgi:hypothetical protein
MRYSRFAVLGLCVFAFGCGGSSKAETPKEFAPVPGEREDPGRGNTKGSANAPSPRP